MAPAAQSTLHHPNLRITLLPESTMKIFAEALATAPVGKFEWCPSCFASPFPSIPNMSERRNPLRISQEILTNSRPRQHCLFALHKASLQNDNLYRQPVALSTRQGTEIKTMPLAKDAPLHALLSTRHLPHHPHGHSTHHPPLPKSPPPLPAPSTIATAIYLGPSPTNTCLQQTEYIV